MKHQLTTFKLSIIAGLVLSANTVSAEENNKSEQLDTVQVIEQNATTLSEQDKSLTISAMKTTTGLTLSPKETPQSVSVVTKSHLDERSVNTMEEALKTTTGINVIGESGYFRYQSRGFYIDQIEEDGISSTVRGSAANVFRDPQSMTDLAIYDHIEVVRGATGLTQANSEPGGTINAVRKRPTSEFQANGNFQFNSLGKARNVTDVSGTIAKGLRGRFVSVLENDPTTKDLPKDNDKRLIYGVVDTEIGSNSQLTVGALYQNTHNTPDIYGVPMGINGTESGLERDTYLGYDWNREKSRKLNIFAEFETFFNEDWTLNNKINYIKNYNTNQFGYIATTNNKYEGLKRGDTIATNNLQRYDNKGDQITFQSNLTGKYSLLSRKHDVFLSYTYNRETADTRWRRVRNSDAYDPFDFTGAEIAQPNWNTDYNDQTFYDRQIYSHGVTLGTRFNPLENLHLLAGSRYTHWKRVGNTNYDIWNNKPDSDTDEHVNLTRSRFIPYFGITYDINPNNSLYASYTSIFKPNSSLDQDGKVIKPVIGTNYELGWKSEWFNGKLNTTLALFQISQKNRPVYIEDSNHHNGGYYGTLGKVRSRGVDMEISGNLTEDWQLFAGYTFNRSKYLETESSRYVAGENYSKHTPKHIFRLYTHYVLPFDNKKWSVGAGVSTQSDTESLYSVSQAGYALWDANIHYQISPSVALSIVGKNLADKRYYENSRIRTMGINNLYGQERTVVFNLDWKF